MNARAKIAENLSKYGEDKYPFMSVFGGLSHTQRFSDFYKNNSNSIDLMCAKLFDDYWSGKADVSRDEIAAYKQALIDINNFFVSCSVEVENHTEDHKEESK